MTITINTKKFIAAANLVGLAIERRNAIPVLGAVLLETHGDKIRLVGTDLDMEIEKASKGRPFQTAEEAGATLESARETERAPVEETEKEIDADAVFAKLKSLTGNRDEEEEERF